MPLMYTSLNTSCSLLLSDIAIYVNDICIRRRSQPSRETKTFLRITNYLICQKKMIIIFT
jgi:hypothetical protein